MGEGRRESQRQRHGEYRAAGARLWLLAFDFVIPSYLAGMIGGLAAIPAWEFMRWFNAKQP